MIPNRPILTNFDYTATFEELLTIPSKASNHKASGTNNLPMDALKVLALDVSPLDIHQPHVRPILFVLEMISSIWEGGMIPEEW